MLSHFSLASLQAQQLSWSQGCQELGAWMKTKRRRCAAVVALLLLTFCLLRITCTRTRIKRLQVVQARAMLTSKRLSRNRFKMRQHQRVLQDALISVALQ